MDGIGNYSYHAKYWNWSGYDRSQEHKFWLEYAEKYGKNILIPMCAWGETGAYMAEHGYNVTIFDITQEMITESKKNFGNIPNLQILQGDIRDFNFDISVDFCFVVDFGHILSIDDIKRALICIKNHLRNNGCLVIQTDLRMPNDISFYNEPQIFYPVKQMYPNKKVWKKGDTRYDSETGRRYVSQTFYTEHIGSEENNIESFNHAFCLQAYYREEWLAVFKECGFHIKREYGNRGEYIFEVLKS
ncbi:MAG: class I SAM-dependent methyltransferase [Defluviitaleaceae bacterium]|nr:class I SAM-dependent methyltransferase [Defluviitaleaceae bacterium]